MQLKQVIKGYLSLEEETALGLSRVVLLIGIIYALPYLFAKKNEPFAAKQTDMLLKANGYFANRL